MSEALDIHYGGEHLQLWPQRALYWPARRRLMIADLHLGKGEVFRSAGIAVPTGGTGQDLQRLSEVLAATGARSLWVLGDFLHAARSARADAAWQAFRQAQADVGMAVVLGNHDRAFHAPDAGVEVQADGVGDGPFVFRHAPADGEDAGQRVVCGHLHPVVRLPGFARRQPVFMLRRSLCVLPAFSAFTGGWPVQPEPQTWLAVCGGPSVVPLGAPDPSVAALMPDTGAGAGSPAGG